MENIYYSSEIEYLFIKKIQQMIDLQYKPMKKEIIDIILQELLELQNILKNKNTTNTIKDESSNWDRFRNYIQLCWMVERKSL